MYYTEYKSASIRHLNTCRHLIDNLHLAATQQTERNILLNIYYLAGYTIECIVNFAIYDYIQFSKTNDVKSLSLLNNSYNVSFYPSKKNNISANFIIHTHNFQKNCQFFSAQSISDASKIPHFDNYIPNPSLVPLFNDWKPEVRYIDKGFSKTDILAFFNLAEQIHSLTRIHITNN